MNSRYRVSVFILPFVVLAGCAMSHVKETDLPYGAGKHLNVMDQQYHLLGSNSASTTGYQCTPPEKEGGKGTCAVVPFSSQAHSDNNVVGEATVDTIGEIGSTAVGGRYAYEAAKQFKKGMIGAARERRPDTFNVENNSASRSRNGPINNTNQQDQSQEQEQVQDQQQDQNQDQQQDQEADGGSVYYPRPKPVKPMPPKPPKPCPRTGGCPRTHGQTTRTDGRKKYYEGQGLGAGMFDKVYLGR